MTFTFRPAVREAVGLIVGLAGSSGSGKTFSAMRLATGASGGKPFAVIDTEGGRATHYSKQFQFDHGNLKSPFSPDAYAEAIEAADKADYPVIVIDSMSHVWEGDGGVLDQHEIELQRMAKGDSKKRESCKMAAWISPKRAHRRMVSRLLQVRAHLILCFRAEDKIDIVWEDGKTKIIPKRTEHGWNGWVPICEKRLPYEMTASFLLMREKPGIPNPIKLQEQHKGMFAADQLISEDSGKAMAAWAAGGAKNRAAPKASATPTSGCITEKQAREIGEYAEYLNVDLEKFRGWLKQEWDADSIEKLPTNAYDHVMKRLADKAAEKRGTQPAGATTA